MNLGGCFLAAGPGMAILRLAAVMGYPPFTVSAACSGVLLGVLACGTPGGRRGAPACRGFLLGMLAGGSPGGRRGRQVCGDRAWAGQAAAAGGPQAASSRFIH